MEIQTIQSALAGVKRIDEFLAQDEFAKQDTKAPDGPVVRFDNVTFGYDDKNILNDFSFEVRTGEQVTLSGRTGAGKSTIFKLILGLYRPDRGSVTIGGVNSADIPDKAKRRLFGYVEQSFHMVPGTVKDQITLFDESVTMDEVKKAAELTGLDDAIMSLPDGYDTKCTADIFSQGQWQLLSIARAAAAQPKLLLLDEPVSGLDPMVTAEMYELIADISRSGVTVVMVTHDVSAALKYAGHILCMRQGLTRESWFFGTPEEFLTSSASDFLKGGAVNG